MTENECIRAVTVATCGVITVLELVHPAWSGAAVAEAVGPLWVPLHLALISAYGVLTAMLWREAAVRAKVHPRAVHLCRAAVVVFLVANTTYLVVDGLVVGLRAQTDAVAVETLWGSPMVSLIANVTGAAWCLSLLALATAYYPARVDLLTAVLLAITWLVFLASATALPAAPLLGRGAAIVSAAWLAFRAGSPALPSALLTFSAVLRQHVGPEAALGVLLVAAAVGWPASFRRT